MAHTSLDTLPLLILPQVSPNACDFDLLDGTYLPSHIAIWVLILLLEYHQTLVTNFGTLQNQLLTFHLKSR